MHGGRSTLVRARIVVLALTLLAGVVIGAAPAHADNDTIDNHLCLDTGFGYYGVSDHVHITDTGGTYHISTFGQASAWTYFGTGQYCYQNSANLGCTTAVWSTIYQNGLYLATTPTYSNSGIHSVSTGNHSYGTSGAYYLVESYVKTFFGNSCTSESDGAVSTYDYN